MGPTDLAPSLPWFGLAWGALLAAAGYAIALALGGSLLKGISQPVILAAIAAIPAMLAVRYRRYFLLGRNQLLRFNAINIALAVAWVIFVAVSLVVLGGGVAGAMWAYAAANVVAFAAALALVPGAVALPNWRRAIIALRTLAAFGLRAQLSTVLQFFSYRLDLFSFNAPPGLGARRNINVAALLTKAGWSFPASLGP